VLIEGVPPLAALSWLNANYPKHADGLQQLEVKIRERVSTREVTAKKEESE
jgi:hypothetical protein